MSDTMSSIGDWFANGGQNPDGTGSFSNALSSPLVSALMGFTGKAAEMAAPSRYKHGLGEVLGSAIGGALPGMVAGQSFRSADIKNQQANIGLNWYKQQMGGAGAPFGAPMAAGSSGVGTDQNGNYLISPKMLASMLPMLVGSGQERAVPAIAGLIQHYSGGPGNAMAPNGTAFQVSGGGADPAVLQRSAAATAAGTQGAEAPYKPPITVNKPEIGPGGKPTGNTTTEEIPVTAWAAQNAGGTQGQSGAAQPSPDPFPGWAKQIVGSEKGPTPDAQNPRSTATGNGQFLDGTWPSVLRATRPDLAAGKTDAQIMALRNDPDVAQSATEIYARQNGGALAQSGLPVNGTTVALAHQFGPGGAATILRANPNAPLSMLPGMGSVVQANPDLANLTAGQVAQRAVAKMGSGSPATAGAPQYGGKVTLSPAAESALKVQTAKNMPYDLRPGGMHVEPDTQTDIKNPELREITNADGTKSFVHINPSSPFQPDQPGTAAPVLTAGKPVGVAVPPDQQAARTELVKEHFGKDADSYVAAQNTQAWLNQIDHAADVQNTAGSVYQTGPFAPQRLALLGGINDVGRSLNLGQPFDQNAIASAEELRKATTTAGFELSSHYEGHARQAAATIMNATSAVPGMSNSPQGVKLVSAGIREGAQSAMDLHEYKQARYDQRQGAGLENAETDFYRANPASMYANRAISSVQPFKITATEQAPAMAEMSKYLPGTMVTLANGKVTMVPERPGAPPIPAYLKQRLAQPHAP